MRSLRLVELLDAASTETEGEGFRRVAVAHMVRVIGADSSFFVPFDEQFLVRVPSYVRRFGEKEVYRRNMAPCFQAGAATGGAFIDSEVFSARERDTLPVFVDLMRPTGITSTLCAAIHFRGQASGLMHLSRHGGRPFAQRELERALPLIKLIGALHATYEPPAAQPSPHARALLQRLTAREREIVGWLARGFQNQQIAANLGISVHTVRHQVESIFKKSGVFSRTDLAIQLAGSQPPRGPLRILAAAPELSDGARHSMLRTFVATQRVVRAR